MTLNITLFGHTGQVATEIQRLAKPRVKITALGRDAADLAIPGACAAAIQATNADVIINAAAYTAVDNAEANETLAMRINAEAPGEMAVAAAARGLPFLHISTDYVFAGSGTHPHKEDDPTNPLSVYGRSKLAGEHAVAAAAGGAYAILRTAWVFSAHGSNFVKTMLRLGVERSKLTIVADQVGGPTPAPDIAEALVTMANLFHEGRGQSGIYHFSGSPDVSWADFAREIFSQANIACAVEDIPTSAYPTPATRPANSRLDCTATETVLGIKRPDWRHSLKGVLAELA